MPSSPSSSPPPPGSAPGEGLRARHKRDKQERLRQAAWELFSSRGYERTTTRDIAERAGVATGTLFLYAKDKADLLFLVFEHRLAETVDDAFETLPDDATVDQLLHVFRRLFDMYARSPEVARHFIKELPGADGPNARRVNGLTLVFLQRIGGLLERAQERGEVRKDVLPLLAAQTTFGLYYMALASWLGGWNSLDSALETTLRGSLTLLFDGLRAR